MTLDQQIKEQDKIYTSINSAANLDIEKKIKVYEKNLLDPPVELHCQRAYMELAEMYCKTGQHDKAWGYLNSLLFTGRAPDNKIRRFQGKILKKEKRYLDALLSYSLGHREFFTEKSFISDTKVCFTKLGWTDNQRDSLIDLIQNSATDQELIDGFKRIADA